MKQQQNRRISADREEAALAAIATLMKQRKSVLNNSRATSTIGNISRNDQREEPQENIGFGGLGDDDNLMTAANEGSE